MQESHNNDYIDLQIKTIVFSYHRTPYIEFHKSKLIV